VFTQHGLAKLGFPATDRSCFELSVGILVALALAAVWPERQTGAAKKNAE
jgi:hypothetical protein